MKVNIFYRLSTALVRTPPVVLVLTFHHSASILSRLTEEVNSLQAFFTHSAKIMHKLVLAPMVFSQNQLPFLGIYILEKLNKSYSAFTTLQKQAQLP